jgi:hypothetical protein
VAHVNSTATGTVTTAATQLAQFYRRDVAANTFTTFGPMLTRGAPRTLIHLNQTAGAVGAKVEVQVSVSDEPADLKYLTITTLVLPPGAPFTYVNQVPCKYMRLRVAAPLAVGVTVEAAIMVAQ